MSIFSKEHVSTMLLKVISEIEGISEDSLKVNPHPDSSGSEPVYYYKVIKHESNKTWYKGCVTVSDILVYLFLNHGN